MKPIFFVLLTMVSFASLADANDASREKFAKMITDEHRLSIFKGYIDSIEEDLPLAESGDSSAMYRLYKNFDLLANIHEVNGASAQAWAWLQRSAALKHPEALIALGHIYKSGYKTFNIEKDLEKAAEYFKTAWENGDKSAEFSYKDIIECELPNEKAWDC